MKSPALVLAVLLATSLAGFGITYEEWRAAVFTSEEIEYPDISGEQADPDGDGRVNLLEFALDTDPHLPDAAAGSTASLHEQGRLALSFTRWKQFTGILYAPQVAGTLGAGWFTGSGAIEVAGVAPRDAATDTVTVRDKVGSAFANHRFLRLLIAVDSDGDGLPDDWEMELFGNLDQAGADDYDLDGLNNLYEWENGGGAYAVDFYNGRLPALAILSGDQQAGGPLVFLPQPLVVEVRNTSGALLANAPVRFEMTSGSGLIALATTEPVGTTLLAHTDSLGRAAVWFRTSQTDGASVVRATAETAGQVAGVLFTASTATIPSAPTHFDYELLDDQATRLSWESHSSNESGFIIEQSLDGLNWASVVTAAASTESITAPTTPGVAIFRVRAINAAGESKNAFDPAFAAGDLDGDGLNNQEDEETADIGNPNTDGDGVPDGEDGWPRNPDLSPPRVRTTGCVIFDLGDFEPVALNNKNQVAGQIPQGLNAVLWSKGQTILAPAPAGTSWLTKDISDSGLIVGTGYINGMQLGFYWREGDPIQSLLTPFGQEAFDASLGQTWANGITNSGLIVGSTEYGIREEDDDGRMNGIKHYDPDTGQSWYYASAQWQAGSSVIPTHLVPPGYDSFADFEPRAVNDAGVVAGTRWLQNLNPTMIVLQGGVETTLGAGLPQAINADGAVLSYRWLAEGDSASQTEVSFKNGGAWRTEFVPIARATRLNARYQAVGYDPQLWQNQTSYPLDYFYRKESGWDIRSVADINDHGVILARGRKTKGADGNPLPTPIHRAVLLAPVIVYDDSLNSPTVAMRGETVKLVQIQQVQDVIDQAIIPQNGIAWIRAHTDDANAAPQMPQLTARTAGLNLGNAARVRWRLRVTYNRGNGARPGRNRVEDTVLIPIPPGREANYEQWNPANQQPAENWWTTWIAAGQDWRIFQDQGWINELQQRGLFGGTAQLFCQVEGQPPPLPNRPTCEFRIGGENPTDGRCRQHIDGRPGIRWYYYAIAKHETKDYNNYNRQGQEVRTRYNHFWEPTRQFYRNAPTGWPIWNNDDNPGQRIKPGGYGLFQVTGNATEALFDIPRRQIWNWQDNIDAGVAILNYKWNIAPDRNLNAFRWMNSNVRQPNGSLEGQRNQAAEETGAPVPVPDRHETEVRPDGTAFDIVFTDTAGGHPFEDAVHMKLYNGAATQYCSWVNGVWSIHDYSVIPDGQGGVRQSRYVNQVCAEVE